MQLKTGKPRQVVLIGQRSGEHTRRNSCIDKTPEVYRGTPPPGKWAGCWLVLGGRKLPQAWERITQQDWREGNKEVPQDHKQCLFWSQTGKTHNSWGSESSTQKSLALVVGKNELQIKAAQSCLTKSKSKSWQNHVTSYNKAQEYYRNAKICSSKKAKFIKSSIQ